MGSWKCASQDQSTLVRSGDFMDRYSIMIAWAWFCRYTRYILMWVTTFKGFEFVLTLRDWNRISNDNVGAHFSKDFECIFDQIVFKLTISSPTSDGRNSSPRWSWATFEYTGTMYSSRYVDSQPLNLSTTNLEAPNRASKLVEFGQNPGSGACTALSRAHHLNNAIPM